MKIKFKSLAFATIMLLSSCSRDTFFDYSLNNSSLEETIVSTSFSEETSTVVYNDQSFVHQFTAPQGWTYSKRIFQLSPTSLILFENSNDYILSPQLNIANDAIVEIEFAYNETSHLPITNLLFEVSAYHDNTLISTAYFDENDVSSSSISVKLPCGDNVINQIKIMLLQKDDNLSFGIKRVIIREGDFQINGTLLDKYELQNNQPAPSINMTSIYDTKLSDYQDYRGTYQFPSRGEPNLLVIPVNFNDYTCNDIDGGCSNARQDIEKAFFAKSEYTDWESVSSYYYKSSYGQLSIKGKVSDWFNLNYDVSDIESLRGLYNDPTYFVLREAIRWYKSQYDDILDFDNDHDGFIDGVWLVYAAPYFNSSRSNSSLRRYSDLLWAYTYWDLDSRASTVSPMARSYCWASYDFLKRQNRSKVDAHTYIHETGHLLGLDDYYNYNYGSNVTGVGIDYSMPCGGIDMMDYNVGDHNSFSKMLLEWANPTVIATEQKLVLRPFTSSGQFLLIPASTWNGSVFNEFLLVEYYTPTGLNESDAYGYDERYLKCFTESGIKIYHVDNRLYRYAGLTGGGGFTTQISGNIGYYASNTTSSRGYNVRKITLLNAEGTNTLFESGYATNETLLKTGQVFGSSIYNNFSFNDGSSLKFTIQIGDMDEKGVALSISRKIL